MVYEGERTDSPSPVMTFEAGGSWLAVRVDQVDRVAVAARLWPVPLARPEHIGLFDSGQELVPVLCLDPSNPTAHPAGEQLVALLHVRGQTIGLAIERAGRVYDRYRIEDRPEDRSEHRPEHRPEHRSNDCSEARSEASIDSRPAFGPEVSPQGRIEDQVQNRAHDRVEDRLQAGALGGPRDASHVAGQDESQNGSRERHASLPAGLGAAAARPAITSDNRFWLVDADRLFLSESGEASANAS